MRLGLRSMFVAVLVAAASAGAGLVACERASDATRDGGAAVDVPLMAFLSEARSLHHEANVREAENDPAGALRALERLVAAERPKGLPEVEEVLADTFARMAELHTRMNDLAAASRDVEAGLAHAPSPTYFRGHLLEVDGVLEEARASTLADAGQADEASRARARAVELLRQAVAIQERVIRGALDDSGAPESSGRDAGSERRKP
jgi:hypothetical protein